MLEHDRTLVSALTIAFQDRSTAPALWRNRSIHHVVKPSSSFETLRSSTKHLQRPRRDDDSAHVALVSGRLRSMRDLNQAPIGCTLTGAIMPAATGLQPILPTGSAFQRSGCGLVLPQMWHVSAIGNIRKSLIVVSRYCLNGSLMGP